MKNENVLTHLYLQAVLPQMEELVAYDAEAQEAVKGWNCSIQFHVAGGPGVCLTFKNGKCEAKLGTIALPSIALWFPSADWLIRMFAKKGVVVPIIWKGLWHPVILGKFIKLTDRLGAYMEPTEEALKDRKFFELHTRMTLMAAVYGIKAVGENDEEMKHLVASTPNGIMELRVKDGPCAHLILKDGTLTPAKGPAKNPTVTMEIKDIDTAYGVMNGKVDSMGALGARDITMTGLLTMADNLNVVMERIPKYLAKD